MRWSVYQIVKRSRVRREAIALGYVNAPHYSAAVFRAWKRWPEQLDNSQTNRGLSVRVYKTDKMSLGPCGPLAKSYVRASKSLKEQRYA